ncbi:hypothetical protein SAMN05428952_10794 [Nitrosomonas sp. Nm132]|nr:hypothetical protein SAMN05428952_10794 [Nitrosomonas sp. Nm132]
MSFKENTIYPCLYINQGTVVGRAGRNPATGKTMAIPTKKSSTSKQAKLRLTLPQL